jgi:hypothetical protein
MDELERAIMELPLEEPPDGLRASILLATAYHRPAPAFSIYDFAGIGTLGAIALWLIVLLVSGGGALFVETLATISSVVLRSFSNVAFLSWLAAGGATALWLTLFTGSHPVAALSHRSGRQGGR